MGLLLNLILIFNQAGASSNFTNLRSDLNVPENCKEVELALFQMPLETFFVGREGALAMGYTFEYPLRRSDASILWRYFKSLSNGQEDQVLLKKIQKNQILNRDYKIIRDNYQAQGFDFGNEGEVLESLAIVELYQEFPENMYFITGGIEYHNSSSSQTIGELDVYVARRDTCEPVAIGEAKLGGGSMLHKARQQIYRFENFLIDHNAPPMSGEFEPKEPNLMDKGLSKAS